MLIKSLFFTLLASLAISNRNITVFGNTSLGYYYIEALIGTPPQRKSLILDTGSKMTIFPCESCLHCGKHIYGLFNTTSSSTFQLLKYNETNFGWKCGASDQNQTCTFLQSYAEGSDYKGFYGRDVFVFPGEIEAGNVTDKTHIFGCATEETGEFVGQKADGIIGVGLNGQATFWQPPTLLDIEREENRIDNKTFALCLGKNGGQMRIGDWNTEKHLNGTDLKFVDCSALNWQEQYYITLSSIAVD